MEPEDRMLVEKKHTMSPWGHPAFTVWGKEEENQQRRLP